MTELLLNNFVAWSAQIAVLIGIGAVAALTIAPGRARLLFWQILLAIALLLPAIEPWTSRPVQLGDSISISMSAATVVAAPHPASFVWHRQYWLWIAAAGIAFRVLWLAVGLTRLRRHRLSARPLADPPVPFENLGIRWYVSDTVSGPVTFGWLRPSIVLPSRVCELPADLREAIACHELIHVRRRDWLFVLAEESIRGLFWFHPAVWFALSRIQLAREQAVDSEVVRLLNRDRYLDALLAVASHQLYPADVAPAPLFLKRRQLAERVSAILKETRMSKSRVIASLATVCSAALIAARVAIVFFPLQSPAQSVAQFSPDEPGVTVDAGGKLLHRNGVFFVNDTSGTVTLEATLNTKGEVTDARVLSGPQELRASALRSVLGWHYDASAGAPPTVQISIRYDPAAGRPGTLAVAPRTTTGKQLRQPTTGVLTSIVVLGATPDLEQRVLQAIPVRVNDTFSDEKMAAVSTVARQFDEHFGTQVSWTVNAAGERTATLRLSLPGANVGVIAGTGASAGAARSDVASQISLLEERLKAVQAAQGVEENARRQAGAENFLQQEINNLRGGVGGGVSSGVGVGVSGGVSGGVSAGVAPTVPSTIRVGGNVQSVNLISKVAPVYPVMAKQARIQGVVSLTATIGQDGLVQNLQVISGHPLLVQAALEAVKQWQYKPTLLNNQPVSVITQIEVNFTLNE